MSYKSIFRADLFANQTMLVTGGGSGIGRCTAHELAALGAKVILMGRNEEKLTKTKNEIIEDGHEAAFAICDIRKEADVAETIKNILEEHGPISGLVNNAGGQFPAPLAEISQNGFEAVVRTNLTGGFLVSRELYNQCLSKRGGAIVNIVADMWNGMPNMGHSGAARAGMVNFTKTAAHEWAESNVRVNAVAPGYIISSGLDTYDEDTQEIILGLRHHIPQKRLGTEAEVSSAICFLLSPGASYITGDTLLVDGGSPLGTPMHEVAEHNNASVYDGFHRAFKPKVLS